MYKKLIRGAAVTGILLLFLNTTAHFLYWYEGQSYFDNVMHILGGIFVALLSIIFLRRLGKLSISTGLVLFVVFLTGLAWEIYELVMQNISGIQLVTLPDSILDLIYDLIGGWIALFFVLIRRKRYNIDNAR